MLLNVSGRVLARAELVPAGLAISFRGESGRPRFEATEAGRERATFGLTPEEIERRELVPPEAGPVAGEPRPFVAQRLLAPNAATDRVPPPANEGAVPEAMRAMMVEAQERLATGAALLSQARAALEEASGGVSAVRPLKLAVGYALDALELFLSPLLPPEVDVVRQAREVLDGAGDKS